jgi:SAM-dependent methyltransferase
VTTDTAGSALDRIHEAVRIRYAGAARAVVEQRLDDETATGGCCAGTTGQDHAAQPGPDVASSFGAGLYEPGQRADLPEAALLASLGCGNPTAVAELRPGETVLDLGSGGGIDVLLSAQRVGPGGRAIGLDMTDEMLELARRNAAAAGATNVDFVKGTIEAIPLPDASVDVVISNCVVNLSADKAAVLAGIARVLRPGGRIGISDVVADDALSPEERLGRGTFVGCIAGALSFDEYRAGLAAAGFDAIVIEATHSVGDGLRSAIVRARKPLDWSGADEAGLRRAVPRPGRAVLATLESGSCGPGCC